MKPMSGIEPWGGPSALSSCWPGSCGVATGWDDAGALPLKAIPAPHTSDRGASHGRTRTIDGSIVPELSAQNRLMPLYEMTSDAFRPLDRAFLANHSERIVSARHCNRSTL